MEVNKFSYGMLSDIETSTFYIKRQWLRYYYLYAHKNAVRFWDQSDVRYRNIPAMVNCFPSAKNTYWRTAGDVYGEVAKAALPPWVENGIDGLGLYGKGSMVCLSQAYQYLGYFYNRKPVLADQAQHFVNGKHILVFSISHRSNFASIKDQLHALPTSGDVLLRYDFLGVSFYWISYWYERTQSWVNSHLVKDIKLSWGKFGLVPMRIQLNDVMIAQEISGDFFAQYKLSQNRVSDLTLFQPMLDSVKNIKCMTEGECLLQEALLRMINDLQKMIKVDYHHWLKQLLMEQVFYHLHSPEDVTNWAFAVEQLCEIAYLFHEPSFYHEYEPNALETVVKSLMGIENPGFGVDVKLYPYSMTVVAALMYHYIVVHNILDIAVTSQQYYECASLLRTVMEKKRAVIGIYDSIADLDHLPTLLFVEGHPNNAAALMHFPQDIANLVRKLLRAEKEEKHHVLIIDITMDTYQRQTVQDCLRILAPYIQSRRLDVYMVQSCAKLLQLGTDIFSGGMCIHLGGDHFEHFVFEDDAIDKLSVYLSWFMQLNGDLIERYAGIIHHNTQHMYQALKTRLSGSDVRLVTNTDSQTAYLSMVVDSLPHSMADIKTRLMYLMSNHSGCTQRRSFGFSLSNMSTAGDVIRVSVGLESEGYLFTVAGKIAVVAHVWTIVSRFYMPDNDDDVKMLYMLIRDELLNHTKYSAVAVKYDVLDVDWFGPPPKNQNAMLSLTSRGVMLCSDRGKYTIQLPRSTRLALSVLNKLGLTKKMSISLRDGELHIEKVVAPFRYQFSEELQYIEQQEPLHEARIALDANVHLRVDYQKVRYDYSKIYLRQPESGKKWIQASLLDDDRQRHVMNKCVKYPYTVEVVNQAVYLRHKKNRRTNHGHILQGVMAANMSLTLIFSYAIEHSKIYDHVVMQWGSVTIDSIMHKYACEHRWQAKDLAAVDTLVDNFEWQQSFYQAFVCQYVQFEHVHHDEFFALICSGKLRDRLRADEVEGIVVNYVSLYQRGDRIPDEYYANIRYWLMKYYEERGLLSTTYVVFQRLVNMFIATHDDQDWGKARSEHEERLLFRAQQVVSSAIQKVNSFTLKKQTATLMTECFRLFVERVCTPAADASIMAIFAMLPIEYKRYWLENATVYHSRVHALELHYIDNPFEDVVLDDDQFQLFQIFTRSMGVPLEEEKSSRWSKALVVMGDNSSKKHRQ